MDQEILDAGFAAENPPAGGDLELPPARRRRRASPEELRHRVLDVLVMLLEGQRPSAAYRAAAAAYGVSWRQAVRYAVLARACIRKAVRGHAERLRQRLREQALPNDDRLAAERDLYEILSTWTRDDLQIQIARRWTAHLPVGELDGHRKAVWAPIVDGICRMDSSDASVRA